MTDLVLVLTTMPDDDQAEAVARTLVDEQLAACVNVGAALTSVYRWRGAVEQARERPLLIKTRAALLAQLEQRLTALHPYELPEFVVLDAAASGAYAAWVRASSGGSAGG